jgi:hypothetical protein
MSENSPGSLTPALLDSLSALFLPHVRTFVAPAVEQEMRTPISAEDLAVIDREAQEATNCFVDAWLQALAVSAMVEDGSLSLTSLDECLLPRSLDIGIAAALAASSMQCPGCDGRERDILWRVKTTLPAYLALPDEAIE